MPESEWEEDEDGYPPAYKLKDSIWMGTFNRESARHREMLKLDEFDPNAPQKTYNMPSGRALHCYKARARPGVLTYAGEHDRVNEFLRLVEDAVELGISSTPIAGHFHVDIDGVHVDVGHIRHARVVGMDIESKLVILFRKEIRDGADVVTFYEDPRYFNRLTSAEKAYLRQLFNKKFDSERDSVVLRGQLISYLLYDPVSKSMVK